MHLYYFSESCAMQDREKYQVESKVHDFNDQICERQ